MKRFYVPLVVLGLIILAGGAVMGRSLPEDNRTVALKAAAPSYAAADHDVGRLVFTITNHGVLGAGFATTIQDYFTGDRLQSAEFPAGSGHRYLFGGGLWIGAVVGNDTLVSVGADGWQNCREMVPDGDILGALEHRSTIDPHAPEYMDAVSEQDFIAEFTDSIHPGFNDNCADYLDGRLHMPLNIKVTRNSYAWSEPGLRDMVFMEYFFKNIGDEQLDEVYIGYYVDADVGAENLPSYAQDDITGFLQTAPQTFPCLGEVIDTVNTAWIADNDGDPDYQTFTSQSARHVTGMRILSAGPSQQISYNWWVSNGTPSLDFGPRHKASPRDFETGGRGTPEGDRNKYHVLSNGEFDYDQIFTGTITPSDTLWELPPQENALILSRALDTRYLLSAGPYDIAPGDSLRWMIVYLAGENFHINGQNFMDNLLNYQPEEYYNNVSFSDLGDKAAIAERFYDTPGIDTDSDGYAGEFVLCEGDTIWTHGDGVPDWRHTVPPQSPVVWAEREGDSIEVRFNGMIPETEKDRIINVNQFEGYVVYLAEDAPGAQAQPQRVAGFDRQNYVKYHYQAGGWMPDYQLYTLEELRCAYGTDCNDSDFNPLTYTPSDPYAVVLPTDSLLYFEKYGFNVPLGVPGIHKRFPNQPYPSTLDISKAQPDELTDDGYFKYFEYAYTVTGLQPDKEYRVGVTTIEYGAPGRLTPDSESPLALIDTSPGCCVGIRGDVNYDGAAEPDALDLSFMVDFLFAGGVAPACDAEANFDGSSDGLTSIDLAMLVDYVFAGGVPPAACE